MLVLAGAPRLGDARVGPDGGELNRIGNSFQTFRWDARDSSTFDLSHMQHNTSSGNAQAHSDGYLRPLSLLYAAVRGRGETFYRILPGKRS
ncbi:fibronectin type-III domain-containing protein 3A-like protein [Anopheles sinensis]|uniref:Fibronectin type-III domain-containing protein 3A-like protein n=1 Tax=Anopheles sinensis TaxID=74873 RepID=A0A084VZL4_ANOSI|nr:fibronectin type-III domain-containing protein 3A-like protein [Anopheles sinensis]